MNHRLPILMLSLSLGLPTAGLGAGVEAVHELGQPDFRSFIPNRLDARGMAQPRGVAVDTSRSPNGLWVLDAGNNRVLGWRDVTKLRDGAPADMVIGQPDALSNGCNNGGVSAASLCLVQAFNGFVYLPGLAVDAEGNLYVADTVNYRVLGYRRPFETDGVADVVIGQSRFDQVETPWGRALSGSVLFNPRGLATDPQGNLYVSDQNCVLELDRPLATDGIADRIFGQPSLGTRGNPTNPGAADQIGFPDGVAVDAQGRLYVGDSYSDRVMVWTQPLARQGAADLVFRQSEGACDPSAGCGIPKGIAIGPGGDIWVAGAGKILGYRSPFPNGDTEPDGVIQAADIKAPVDGRPRLTGGGLAIDSSGALWLADENRVLGFFDPWHGDGRADRLLGQVRRDQFAANFVDGDGLNAPDGIAFDTSSNPPHLYVVDALNSRVLGWANAESFSDGQPADLVLGQPDRWSSGCNTGGLSLASLCLDGYLNSVVVDAHGTVWVTDPGNQRVLGYRSPFTTDTVADWMLGGTGCVAGPRGLCAPAGLAVDKAGNLYVADIVNNRILGFNDPSHHDTVADRVLGARNLRQFGCNDDATCFSFPLESHPGLEIDGGLLAIDAKGRLLVANKSAVYVFDQPLRSGSHSRKLRDFFPNSYQLALGFAVDSADRIYVTLPPYVYRFSAKGGPASLTLGGGCAYGYYTGFPEGLGRASLCSPAGLAVGPGDELFVSDAGTNRVMVFDNP